MPSGARSCAHICRKRKLVLLLFINVVSHSRPFFFLFTVASHFSISFPSFCTYCRTFCGCLWLLHACVYDLATCERFLRLSTFMQLRGLSSISEEKNSETFFLSRAIYNLVFRTLVAISPSMDRIIYVVCRIFSLTVQTRGEWKVRRKNIWKVHRNVSKESYYKNCSLAISRRSSATILLPILTSSLISSRSLDPSIAGFSLFLFLFFLVRKLLFLK